MKISEVKGSIHEFLTSTIDEDEWSTTLPRSFTLRQKNPIYPLDMRF